MTIVCRISRELYPTFSFHNAVSFVKPTPMLQARLMHQPILLAQWFGLGNRWRAFCAQREQLWFVTFAVIVLAGVVGPMLWQTLRTQSSELIALSTAHPIIVAVVIVAAGFSISLQARGAQERAHAASWLAALPLARRQLRVAFLLPVAMRVLALCTLLALMPALAGSSTAHYPVLLVTALVGANLIGAFAGWRVGRPRRGSFVSKYTSRKIRTISTEITPSPNLQILGLWPLREQRASASAAVAAGVLLLLLPMGVPPYIALLGLACWLLALKLGAHASVLLALTAPAAQWLRATPLGFAKFARALSLPTLLLLLVGSAILSLGLIALGASRNLAGVLAAAALGLVLLALCCALACRFRPERLGFELAAWVIALAALAQSLPILFFPILLLLCLWQWRRASMLR